MRNLLVHQGLFTKADLTDCKVVYQWGQEWDEGIRDCVEMPNTREVGKYLLQGIKQVPDKISCIAYFLNLRLLV